MHLPACGSVGEVAIADYLFKDMVGGVGHNESGSKVALGDIGQIDIHVGKVVTAVGDGGVEGKCSDFM